MSNGSTSSPLISVIVLNFNGKDILEPCIRSVLNSNYPIFEVILVDNASSDGSLEQAEELYSSNTRLKIVRNSTNLGFDEGNNVGIRHSKGEYVIFLNNDTVVDVNWLKKIEVVFRDDENIGAAQPKIRLFDYPRRIDNVGNCIDFFGFALPAEGRLNVDLGQYDSVNQFFYAAGSAMIVRRKVLDEVGFFDRWFFCLYEDVDLSWRIRLRGYKIVLIPEAIVYHRCSASVSKKPKPILLWHLRKNRIATVFKNYAIRNLLRVIPVVLLMYLITFIVEVTQKKLSYAATIPLAILHNLKEFKYLWQQRMIVQRKIRCVSDEEITKLMPMHCALSVNLNLWLDGKSVPQV